MDMFVVKRPNPVSSTAASPVARKKARQGDVTCLTYVVQTLYFAAPLPHFLSFLPHQYRTFWQNYWCGTAPFCKKNRTKTWSLERTPESYVQTAIAAIMDTLDFAYSTNFDNFANSSCVLHRPLN